MFDGSITPANYNQAWVDLKRKYQGVVPPVARSEADFDPGAKFHIPGNTSYARYFLARVMQFNVQGGVRHDRLEGPAASLQLLRQQASRPAPQRAAGDGVSKPWPDALQAFTGSREISGKPMVEYFAPLKSWLEQQNAQAMPLVS